MVKKVIDTQEKQDSNEDSSDTDELKPIDEWIKSQDFKTTADIKVPKLLLDQVIGQDKAVEIVRKAAEQKRHVMLIGDP
ncbi:MAG: hypothetical protein DRM98_05140, partial [Thermoplasmata archaeon]